MKRQYQRAVHEQQQEEQQKQYTAEQKDGTNTSSSSSETQTQEIDPSSKKNSPQPSEEKEGSYSRSARTMSIRTESKVSNQTPVPSSSVQSSSFSSAVEEQESLPPTPGNSAVRGLTSKGGKKIELSYQEMARYFNCPQPLAARLLGVSYVSQLFLLSHLHISFCSYSHMQWIHFLDYQH
jgi:outer membrane translocation and assembly module TamA